ncbi:MAG: hypothetical protein JRD93_10430 [Deltaproteobacteria bacterium]|nr:hypothetical protein [Deltaproteobacteria bacterium]
MGFFSKLFGSETSEIDSELENQYVPMFQNMMGMPIPQAKSTFRDMLKQAKEESVKDRTSNLPQNFGDLLLEEESTNPHFKSMLAKKRAEGVIDEDVRWFWNMHDLERRMMLKVDDLFQLSLFIKLREEDRFNEKEAANKVKKFHPMYGDPDDPSQPIGDDKVLPRELKDRVNRYIEKREHIDKDEFKKEIEDSSTFNAFIRKEIKRGNL